MAADLGTDKRNKQDLGSDKRPAEKGRVTVTVAIVMATQMPAMMTAKAAMPSTMVLPLFIHFVMAAGTAVATQAIVTFIYREIVAHTNSKFTHGFAPVLLIY
jgi:hypothetical protein